MKKTVLLMLVVALDPIPTRGQELVGTLSLTAEAGYLTNTYLHPVLPLWVPADAPFLGVAPSLRLAWTDGRTYAAVDGSLRLLELTDRAGLWWMGSSQARIHRALGRAVGIGIDGSLSRIGMEVQQWLAWAGPYVTTRLGAGTHFIMRLGTSYRFHEGDTTAAAFAEDSYFAVAQLSRTAADRWDLGGHAYVTHSFSGGAGPFGVGAQVTYSLSTGWSLGVEVGAERFHSELEAWQSAAVLDWDMSNAASWTGRFGVQRFITGAETSSDVFTSIGLAFRLQHRRDLSPPPALQWRQRGDEMVLRFTYDDDGTLFLVGDFNEWRIGEIELRNESDDVYTARLNLPPGTYEYKIMAVEGGARQWLPLPDDALTTDDDFGGTNGILLVEEY